ncbi:hypothetical protein P8452_54129 [Trifolium repens]|nr:hypothetical protein P8452_54129 [Trifolium repens]
MPTSSSSDRLSSLSDDILIRIMSLNPTQDAVRTLKEMIELNFFDTVGSSTAAPLPCSHPICTYGGQSPAAQCSPQVNQCSYTFQYEDGSGTSGAYVSDELYFDMILGQSTPGNVNSSATIVFGCSTSQSGDLTKTDRAGDANGGGILVLGEILEPSIVYSPLVPSQPHYNLILRALLSTGNFSQLIQLYLQHLTTKEL